MKNGPLEGIKVVDLSRVLAGPVCTQMLGDLGADVIKIERPGTGDDTRLWGPPFLKDAAGNDTTESAYYLSANRNKASHTLDFTKDADKKRLHAMLAEADVLVENFKPGSLQKLGLDYETLHKAYPRLVYCSITGFGHTGPMSREPGYDFLAQGLTGFMSITGPVVGPPSKAGVAVIDYVTGQNAVIGILAALRAREATGKGQHIDVALFDSGLAMMTNIAEYALVSGENPPRVGNAHTTIVPYNAFEASDGWIILAVGNDRQFEKFAGFAGHPEWATNPNFKTNSARVTHRDEITKLIADKLKTMPQKHWVDGLLAIDVPCGPILSMCEAFHYPQAIARGMIVEMDHIHGRIRLVGNPLKFSDTPVTYRKAPPINGQDD